MFFCFVFNVYISQHIRFLQLETFTAHKVFRLACLGLSLVVQILAKNLGANDLSQYVALASNVALCSCPVVILSYSGSIAQVCFCRTFMVACSGLITPGIVISFFPQRC